MVHQNVGEQVFLSIDTSGGSGSIALARCTDQKIKTLKETHWQKNAAHSEMATVALENLLKDTATELQQLTHILVNVGPGSFTGIRVGLTLAMTLAYSLDLPIAPIARFAPLALSHRAKGKVLCLALKAVQDFYYFAKVDVSEEKLKLMAEPVSLRESELKKAAQNNALLIEGQSANFSTETRAQSLIQVQLDHSLEYPFSSWAQVRPLYIRGSEAEEKLKRGVLKPLI